MGLGNCRNGRIVHIVSGAHEFFYRFQQDSSWKDTFNGRAYISVYIGYQPYASTFTKGGILQSIGQTIRHGFEVFNRCPEKNCLCMCSFLVDLWWPRRIGGAMQKIDV